MGVCTQSLRSVVILFPIPYLLLISILFLEYQHSCKSREGYYDKHHQERIQGIISGLRRNYRFIRRTVTAACIVAAVIVAAIVAVIVTVVIAAIIAGRILCNREMRIRRTISPDNRKGMTTLL